MDRDPFIQEAASRTSSPDRPRVSVLIAAARGFSPLLEACLRSIALHGPQEISYEVIVVLNGGAGVRPAATATLPNLTVLSSRVNLGLAGAANYARSKARGELLVLLHDDAEIEPGWLEALVETADLHPEAGAIGGKVLFMDGRLQNAGMILWREGMTSAPWKGVGPSPDAFDELRAVDYCGTSSLMIRAATWDAIGGADERFYPVYYVDVDLAMAIRRNGQVVLYQPLSRIRHHKGGSGHLRWRDFVNARNRIRFSAKWGRELLDHEPVDDGGAEAIQRATERSRQTHLKINARPPANPSPPSARPVDDPAARGRRHFMMAVNLCLRYGLSRILAPPLWLARRILALLFTRR